MRQEWAELVRGGEALLRQGGWQPCARGPAGPTLLPGCSCWRIDPDDPYAPEAFVTHYGYVLEIPHGELSPPSVLRFPRYATEEAYAGAYQRLRRFVERSHLHVAHSADEAGEPPRWSGERT